MPSSTTHLGLREWITADVHPLTEELEPVQLAQHPNKACGSIKNTMRLVLLAHVLDLAVIHEDSGTKLVP